MDTQPYHIPALLPESLQALNVHPGGIYVDVTLGGGGHSHAIRQLLDTGHLYSLDRDSDAIARVEPDAVFTPIHGDFRYLANYLRYYQVLGRVDGILADLGVSFHHFDSADRGFSFRADAPLDMRMNRSGGITAAQFIASASEDDLARIFKMYGELKQARRIAAAIVKTRSRNPILTTQQLVDVAAPMISPSNTKQELAQLFQALRIEVNGEMSALESLLKASLAALKPGGRLAVITYHSLEDRMVKNFMRSGRTDGSQLEKDIFGHVDLPFKVLTSKPIVPTPTEVDRNPRSRSAKLRVAERLE